MKKKTYSLLKRVCTIQNTPGFTLVIVGLNVICIGGAGLVGDIEVSDSVLSSQGIYPIFILTKQDSSGVPLIR